MSQMSQLTIEEKQTIYNLLKTASQNVYGYTPDAFKNEKLPEQIPVKTVTPEPEHISPAEPVQTETPISEITTSTPIPSGVSVGVSMGELILKIARCTRCPLARTRTNVVPGTGSRTPEVLVIGDGPGSPEDNSGLSFTGPAGDLMDKMLYAIKLNRKTNCFLTNAVKCAPPQNRDPYPEETEACAGFIEAQIKCLKPKMILCTGRIAALTLLKNNKEINLSLPVDQLRGKWYDFNSIPVLITYNPSEVLKNPDLKRPVWDDLRTFAAKLKELSPSYAQSFGQ